MAATIAAEAALYECALTRPPPPAHRCAQTSGMPASFRMLSPTARWALICTAVVVVAGALKIAAVAILPIVAALILTLMLWPVRQWLVRFLPRWAAAMLCTAILIAGILLIGGWTAYAATTVMDKFQEDKQRYVDQYQSLRETVTGWGVPGATLPELHITGEDTADTAASPGPPPTSNQRWALSEKTRARLSSLITGGLRSAAGVGAALLLTVFLAFLAYYEGSGWNAWLHKRIREHRYRFVHDLVTTYSAQTRSYFIGKTISGIVSGVATGLWLWFMGVPMPIVWAVFTLLLNYIPNIGALVSGLPPTLLAIVELGWTEGLIVAAGLATIEMLVGNLLDPFLQGNMLQLSTFVVLASLVVWGWLWGIMGALLAPVLTAAVVTTITKLIDFRTRRSEHSPAPPPLPR